MVNRILYWFWFGLSLSLFPVVLTFWKLNGINQSTSWLENLSQAISSGQLLLVCMSILGVNIGELLQTNTNWKKMQLSLTASSFFIALFTTYSFAEINTNPEISLGYTVSTSFWMLFATVSVCLSSFMLPKSES